MSLSRRCSIAALLVAMTGCAAEIEEDAPEPVRVADPLAAGLVSRDWVGFKVGAQMPEYYDLGVIEVSQEGEGELSSESALRHAKMPEHLLNEAEGAVWEMVDFETSHRYLVHMTPDSERISNWVSENIHNQDVAGRDVDLGPTLMDKSVVGTDKRARIGIADGYPKSGSYLQTIGRTSGGCSGTLVAQNIMLTAAHCVFNSSGVPANYTFYPRRDGTSTTPTPWGGWTAQSAHYPAEYTAAKCHTNYADTTCSKWDIALVKVTKPSSLAGWSSSWEMAYGYETRTQLDTRALRNYGYPGCSSLGAPVPCTNYTLYRDADNCRLGINQNGTIDGVTYQVATQHGCDMSPGHSGSAMFYFRTSARPMIVGVNVSHDSSVVGLGTPNWFRRITPDIVNWINANRI